jgi:coenzyme F420-reducing hydrogenase delta subunit
MFFTFGGDCHFSEGAGKARREIESTDKAIDRLVYELYGLSEEEIRIVEGK